MGATVLPNGLANLNRPDVDAVYGKGADHGFSMFFPTTLSTVNVCVYAVNFGGGSNVTLGCKDA